MKPELDLSHDARALIGAARGGDEVSPAQRRGALAAFERRLGDEAVYAARRRSGVRRRPAARFAWALAALVCTGSLAAYAQHRGAFAELGAAIEHALGVRGKSPRVAPRPARAPEPLPEPPSRFEPEAPPPVFAEPPPLAPPDPLERDAAHPSRRAPPALDLNAQELQLISKARDEFRAHRYASALHFVWLHRRRFPKGALSEERDALIAMIDCHLRIGSGLAQSFLGSHPRSLFAEQVRRNCQLPSNAVPGEQAPGTQ